MKSLLRNKKGQFVVIAAMLVAIMMISISPLLHEAATYYTSEPWEEYLALIGGLKLNFQRLVEISLANYTQTRNSATLASNLHQWQTDMYQVYPGRGIVVVSSLFNGSESHYGENIVYQAGLNNLASDWYKRSSFSAASATMELNISSIVLTGYLSEISVFLNMEILGFNETNNSVDVAVRRENNQVVNNLSDDSFEVHQSGQSLNVTVTNNYDVADILVYTITLDDVVEQNFNVTVHDDRGIYVTGSYP